MPEMCPRCGRFTVEWDPRLREKRCFAVRCPWNESAKDDAPHRELHPSRLSERLGASKE